MCLHFSAVSFRGDSEDSGKNQKKKNMGMLGRSFSRLIALTMLVLFSASYTEGAFYLVQGGCIDDPLKWTVRIDSEAENDAVVEFLRTQKRSHAGIGGYVERGWVNWDDGSPMKWKPRVFQPPATSFIGFLVVRDDGSWGVMSYDVFLNTMFVCTEKARPPAGTNTTEKPTETPVPESVSHLLDALVTAMDEVGTFDILQWTVNTVKVKMKAPDLLDQLDMLRIRGHYLVGITFMVRSDDDDDARPQGLATVTRGAELSVQFVVPSFLMESKVRQYVMRVVVTNGMNAPIYRQTMAVLVIHPLDEVLQEVAANVEINEEDILEAKDVIRSVRLTGPETVARHTVDVSPLVLSNLSFTMINNGVVGRTCSPGTLHIKFLFLNGKLQLLLPGEFLARVKMGPKSLCATHGGKSTVIARFKQRHLTITADRSEYAYEEYIRAVVVGASASCLASNSYAAFLSHSERCSSEGDATVSLELETPVASLLTDLSQPQSPLLLLLPPPPPLGGGATRMAHGEQRQEENQGLTLYFTISSHGAQAMHLCVRHVATATKFPVVSSDGKAVKIVHRLTPPPPPPGMISLFSGAMGWIALMDLVLPPRSTADVQHHDRIVHLIAENLFRVRFVPFPSGGEWSRKLVACGNVSAGNELVFDANSGFVQLDEPLDFSEPSGIFCGGMEYLRIDYVVYEPSQWLQFFGGSSAATGFVVLPDLPSASFVVSVTHSDPSAHYALRLGVDNDCRVGFTANIWQISGHDAIVSFPTTAIGKFALCVGVYTAPGGSSLFVRSNRTVVLTSYEEGLIRWGREVGNGGGGGEEEEEGATSGVWMPCGAFDVCGYAPQQPFMEVCGGGAATGRTQWPTIITDRLLSLGSVNVTLSGDEARYPAAVIDGRVFIMRGSFTCQIPDILEMSTDMVVYGTSVVVDHEHTVVSLRPNTHAAGAILGLTPWNEGCDFKSIQQKVLLSGAISASSSSSSSSSSVYLVLDLASLLWDDHDGYHIVCLLQTTPTTTTWVAVSQAYILITRLDKHARGVSAEAIASSNAAQNDALIHLWQTEVATWVIAGSFLPDEPVSLALVWDDPTCRESPAYRSVTRFVSETTSSVVVDVSLIAAPPEPESLLHSCYFTENAPAAVPLRVEEHINRRISIQQLSLSSINHLTRFAVRYDVGKNTRIFLTDPLKPPITHIGLFVVKSPNDKDAIENCSPASRHHVASLVVKSNKVGLQWVDIAPSIPAMLGSPRRDVYIAICATASKHVGLRFVPVSAYLIINGIGTVTQVDPFSLSLAFVPLNDTVSILDIDTCAEALRRYILRVTNRTGGEHSILVTPKGNNSFGLFIEPDAQVVGDEATRQLRAVYVAMAAGREIPLRVHSANGNVFTLFSIEGVHLINQSSYDGLPWVNVGIFETEHPVIPADFERQVITIICVVVAPIALAFVVFSLQRSIPRSRRLGRDEERANSVVTPETVMEHREMDESPPPRRPKSTESAPHITLMSMGTTADPLYDSDDDAAPTVFGQTAPPLPHSAATIIADGGGLGGK